jgi:hypothetical protein
VGVRLTPERLGAPTSINLSFQLVGPANVPAPLATVDIGYPHDLGFATSGLGLAACSPTALAILGPSVCPAESQIGYGTALVELPVGAEPFRESVKLAIFAGPSPHGQLHVLVSATGEEPVVATALLYGLLLPGHLKIEVPPLASFPEGPDIVLASMQLTLGGNLTYFEHVHGQTIPYHPTGIGLPNQCPAGGFRFATTMTFLNAEADVRTSARVPCPGPRRGRR